MSSEGLLYLVFSQGCSIISLNFVYGDSSTSFVVQVFSYFNMMGSLSLDRAFGAGIQLACWRCNFEILSHFGLGLFGLSATQAIAGGQFRSHFSCSVSGVSSSRFLSLILCLDCLIPSQWVNRSACLILSEWYNAGAKGFRLKRCLMFRKACW